MKGGRGMAQEEGNMYSTAGFFFAKRVLGVETIVWVESRGRPSYPFVAKQRERKGVSLYSP